MFALTVRFIKSSGALTILQRQGVLAPSAMDAFYIFLNLQIFKIIFLFSTFSISYTQRTKTKSKGFI